MCNKSASFWMIIKCSVSRSMDSEKDQYGQPWTYYYSSLAKVMASIKGEG